MLRSMQGFFFNDKEELLWNSFTFQKFFNIYFKWRQLAYFVNLHRYLKACVNHNSIFQNHSKLQMQKSTFCTQMRIPL